MLDLINQQVEADLQEAARELNLIRGTFAISRGAAADAIREHLNAERDLIFELADFYVQLSKMIFKVSKDIEKTESHYGNGHISGRGLME